MINDPAGCGFCRLQWALRWRWPPEPAFASILPDSCWPKADRRRALEASGTQAAGMEAVNADRPWRRTAQPLGLQLLVASGGWALNPAELWWFSGGEQTGPTLAALQGDGIQQITHPNRPDGGSSQGGSGCRARTARAACLHRLDPRQLAWPGSTLSSRVRDLPVGAVLGCSPRRRGATPSTAAEHGARELEGGGARTRRQENEPRSKGQKRLSKLVSRRFCVILPPPASAAAPMISALLGHDHCRASDESWCWRLLARGHRGHHQRPAVMLKHPSRNQTTRFLPGGASPSCRMPSSGLASMRN